MDAIGLLGLLGLFANETIGAVAAIGVTKAIGVVGFIGLLGNCGYWGVRLLGYWGDSQKTLCAGFRSRLCRLFPIVFWLKMKLPNKKSSMSNFCKQSYMRMTGKS